MIYRVDSFRECLQSCTIRVLGSTALEGIGFFMPDEHQLKRWFPRRKVNLPCTVIWQDRQVRGKAIDVSYAGLGVLLSEAVDVNVEAKVQIPEGIWLRVRPVYRQQENGNGERYRVGCKIELVERGEQQWMNLCYVPRW